jgi:hypothetical protein
VVTCHDEGKCPESPVAADERTRVLVVYRRELVPGSCGRKVTLPSGVGFAKVVDLADEPAGVSRTKCLAKFTGLPSRPD